VVGDEDVAFELSGGEALELEGEPGDRFVIPLSAPRPGIYSLEVNVVPLEDSPRYEIVQGAEPVGDMIRFGEDQDRIAIRFARRGEDRDRRRLVIDSFRLVPYKEFIKEWMVIGPWDNPENTGLATPQAPEEVIDFSREYTGKDGQRVTWQETVVGENGYVDLVELLEPDQNAVAYAYVKVIAPETMRKTLYVGSDDGVRVWVNGEMVIDHSVKRGIEPDQDSADVRLQKGPNSLLLKIDQGDSAWAFCARFWDPEKQLAYGLDAP
jgi:hypothetical protein